MTAAAPAARYRPLLRVRDLGVSYRTDTGTVRAVDYASFTVGYREIVAIVGESGSGKTATACSILRLLSASATIDPQSVIEFEERDLLALDRRSLRAMRGGRIGMVFQDTVTALDPVFRVGAQVAEVVRTHLPRETRAAAWARAVEMLAAVGLPDPEGCARQYPHELSGGMRQRVMLAIALVMHPALLIADEPTAALDVTVQAQILDLLRDLQQRLGMSILLITHDLGVVAEVADSVIVMSAGRVVETRPVTEFFARPRNPDAAALLAAARRSRLALTTAAGGAGDR
jgi:peptide/nickel transport system ATP-binding protein